MTPATRQLIATLDCQWHEYWMERASILEYEAKIPREEAEQAAWMETSAAMLKARVKKMAEQQSSRPQHLNIHKKVDTAILATGEV